MDDNVIQLKTGYQPEELNLDDVRGLQSLVFDLIVEIGLLRDQVRKLARKE